MSTQLCKWNEYKQLFGEGQERIDLLNINCQFARDF